MRCWVYCKMVCVGPLFGAQAQQIDDSGPRSPRQWICREWVTELGPNEVSVSWLWAIQRLNVRISPSCPLDIRSEETCGCTSVPDQRLWSFSLFSVPSSPFFFLSMGTPFFYIAPFKSSGLYTCWLSGPSLECPSHRTSPLSFCELLWPR